MKDPAKPYELTFEERTHYLFVRIKAETMTREMALMYLREIADECNRHKFKRLLLVRDVPMMLSDKDLFYTTNDFLDMIKGVRLAIVNPYRKNEPAMKFAMLIGTNRSAKFKDHNSVEEAENWLLEGVRVYSRGA